MEAAKQTEIGNSRMFHMNIICGSH